MPNDPLESFPMEWETSEAGPSFSTFSQWPPDVEMGLPQRPLHRNQSIHIPGSFNTTTNHHFQPSSAPFAGSLAAIWEGFASIRKIIYNTSDPVPSANASPQKFPVTGNADRNANDSARKLEDDTLSFKIRRCNSLNRRELEAKKRRIVDRKAKRTDKKANDKKDFRKAEYKRRRRLQEIRVSGDQKALTHILRLTRDTT
jgi:hypothetical protein